jgi:hypothetical protein
MRDILTAPNLKSAVAAASIDRGFRLSVGCEESAGIYTSIRVTRRHVRQLDGSLIVANVAQDA